MERTVRFWIGAGLLSAILICGIGPLALSQEKKEEKKEAPGPKGPDAAVLEARAAHLLRAAKRLVSRKKWSAALEKLKRLKEECSKTEQYKENEKFIEESLIEAETEVSGVRKKFQGKVRLLSKERIEFLYGFEQMKQLGDFAAKGRCSVEGGALKLASGATIWHRFRFAGEVRVRIRPAKPGRLTILLGNPDHEAQYAMAVGIKDEKVSIQLEEDGKEIASGTGEAKDELEIEAVWAGKKVTVGVSGKEILAKDGLREIPHRNVGLRGPSSSILLDEVLLAGRYLPEALELTEAKKLPLNKWIPLYNKKDLSNWRGNMKRFTAGLNMITGKNGSIVCADVAESQLGSYIFSVEIFGKGYRRRRRRNQAGLLFKVGESSPAWIFTNHHSTVFGLHETQKFTTLKPKKWNSVVIKVTKKKVSGYLNGVLMWALKNREELFENYPHREKRGLGIRAFAEFEVNFRNIKVKLLR
jgi:hypothetical protein